MTYCWLRIDRKVPGFLAAESIEAAYALRWREEILIDLALLGRLEHLETLDRAIEEVQAGGVVVLSLIGTLGSGRGPLLDEYERRIREAGIEVRRTEAYPATEVQPGGLAAALNLSNGLGQYHMAAQVGGCDHHVAALV